MAEFCLECFNRVWNKNLEIEDVRLSRDFCEGCGTYKPCVMSVCPAWRKPEKTKRPFFFKKK